MHVVVEGDSDKAAARRVVEFAGRQVHHVTVTRGKTKLDAKLANYSRAARDQPWVVFRDSDNQCPVSLRQRLLAGIPDNPLFALRIVHTMTEAWLMADRLGFSRYFAVSSDTVPVDPEAKAHAKQTLLRLCQRSRNRDIREEVVHGQAHPGPLFVEHLTEFASRYWDVSAAAQSCPSLQRAIAALHALPKAGQR